MINCDYSTCKHCNTSSNTCKKESISISNGEYGAYCMCMEETLDYIRSHYDIRKISDTENNFDLIVFSQCYMSCFDYLDQILRDASELFNNENKKVKIIFDNLMSHGNASNRFIIVEYDLITQEFTEPDCYKVSKDSIIRKISLEYYKSKEDILDRGILNSAQIKLIKKGICI